MAKVIADLMVFWPKLAEKKETAKSLNWRLMVEDRTCSGQKNNFTASEIEYDVGGGWLRLEVAVHVSKYGVFFRF